MLKPKPWQWMITILINFKKKDKFISWFPLADKEKHLTMLNSFPKKQINQVYQLIS
jgi:hypothetical protein